MPGRLHSRAPSLQTILRVVKQLAGVIAHPSDRCRNVFIEKQLVAEPPQVTILAPTRSSARASRQSLAHRIRWRRCARERSGALVATAETQQHCANRRASRSNTAPRACPRFGSAWSRLPAPDEQTTVLIGRERVRESPYLSISWISLVSKAMHKTRQRSAPNAKR